MLANRRSDDPESLRRAAQLVEPFRTSKVPGYLATLGWVELKRGDLASARSILENVVRLAPKVPTFQYHLGLVLIEAGKVMDGRKRIRFALRMKQPFPKRAAAVRVLEDHEGG